MRKDKLIYWTSTVIIASVMFLSALYFAFSPGAKTDFKHLGLPNWFKFELSIAKFLGAIALVIPSVPKRIKEFAYFGFAITLVSADIAQLSSGDSAWLILVHFGFFCILALSFVYYYKINHLKF